MRIVFFGTPDAALPTLRLLTDSDDVEVLAVVTNPDRPRGRSRTPRPPPVKRVALERDLPVWQPERAAEITDDLARAGPDACAVVAYGALLPPQVLEAGGSGFVNLHFSLLPRWRGAAPVHHAIRAGDTITGVTTFVLDEGMDTGPLLRRHEVAIGPEETAGDLERRLAELGAPLLEESLLALLTGEQPTPQPVDGATLAPRITPADAALDWTRPARRVVDLVRASNPAPGAHTTFRGGRLKVWAARSDAGRGRDAPAGTIVDVRPDGPAVAVGDGCVVLTDVQPAGRKRMQGASFANGYQPTGETLGT